MISIITALMLSGSAIEGTSGREATIGFQRRFGPGVCGPADPVYITGATETGGQPFFLSTSEVSKSAQIMGASYQSELMLWASGEGDKTYTVRVDSSVKHASFSASFDNTGGTLTVMSPDGATVQQGERTEDTVLNCGRVVTIDAPATGTWQIKVAPSGRFWLLAHARTELSISTDFVQQGGRPGHEGLFKIQGYPIAGKPATLRVRLSPTMKSPTFRLVSVEAQPLQIVDLKPVGDDEFVGKIALPDERFRVLVTGVDESGVPFQRISAALLHAEFIEVIPPTGESIVAGETTTVTFTVRNSGPAVNLRFTASDGHGKVMAVEPATVQLDSGAETAATVRLAVPADAASGSEASVMLTASGVAPSSVMNYAGKQFTVK